MLLGLQPLGTIRHCKTLIRPSAGFGHRSCPTPISGLFEALLKLNSRLQNVGWDRWLHILLAALLKPNSRLQNVGWDRWLHILLAAGIL